MGVFLTRGHNKVYGGNPSTKFEKTNISFTVTPMGAFSIYPNQEKKWKKIEDWGEDVIHGTMHNP